MTTPSSNNSPTPYLPPPAPNSTTPTTTTSKSTKAKSTTKKKARTSKKRSSSGTKGGGHDGGGNNTGGGRGGGNANNSATNHNEIIKNATLAREELAALRSEAESRKNDAAWLAPDARVVVVIDDDDNGNDNEKNKNKNRNNKKRKRLGFLESEGEILKKALNNVGLKREELTTEAMGCLLEHARRYACELVTDARDYAWHANRRDIAGCDLKLAAEMRDDFGLERSLPPRDVVISLAEEVNKCPLPFVPEACYRGVVLPPKELMITARTFDVLSSETAQQQNKTAMSSSATTGKGTANGMLTKEGTVKKAKMKAKDEVSKAEVGDEEAEKKKKPFVGSYGANKGRQIPVTIKTKKEVPKTDTTEAVAAAATSGASAPGSLNGTGETPMDTSAPTPAAVAPAATPAGGGAAADDDLGAAEDFDISF